RLRRRDGGRARARPARDGDAARLPVPGHRRALARGNTPRTRRRRPDALGSRDDRRDGGERAADGNASSSPVPGRLLRQHTRARLACVDDLYAGDGSCRPNPDPVFPHFTALPPPNDFQADCFRDGPPCTALATETRAAVDAAGNLLFPVNWQGVLVQLAGVPVPRLIHAAIQSPLPFATPAQVFLGSYTPEGAKLPPIFEPQ